MIASSGMLQRKTTLIFVARRPILLRWQLGQSALRAAAAAREPREPFPILLGPLVGASGAQEQ